MSGEPVSKNVLLIALGGSGRRTAVTLREKIMQESDESSQRSNLNLKVVAIDFWPSQESGFFVDQEEYLPLLMSGMNITKCWHDLQGDLKSMPEELQEPWMKVGPISEGELWLARDAQQSGIRRVDYFLFVHQGRERIQKLLREALNALVQDGETGSDITVIIVGSLAGRTGSISYIPVLEILKSLSKDYKFASSFSFLFTPQAFKIRIHAENELNFFQSLSRIRKHFEKASGNSLILTQFLVDEPDSLLTAYREEGQTVPTSEMFERIRNLIDLTDVEGAWSESYEEWLRSIKRVYTLDIESMADRYKQENYYYQNSPFGIRQTWNTSSLELFFANLERNS